MLTNTRRSTVVTRLAVAAVGAGTATCALLVPGAAYAAQPHGDTHGQSSAAHARQASHSNHRSVQLHDRHRWQAQADPDGAENGGVDQPGGQGGTIGAQDGNNGSGNDADCEDDNRGRGIPGHCKAREQQATTTQQSARTVRSMRTATAARSTTTRLVSAGATSTASAPSSFFASLPAWVLPPARVATLAAGPAPSELVSAPMGAELGTAAGTEASAAVAGPTSALEAVAGVMPNTGAPEGLAWFALAGALAIGAGGSGVVAARRTR